MSRYGWGLNNVDQMNYEPEITATEADRSLLPPKEWVRKMKRQGKPEQLIGYIWWHSMSDAKRAEIRARYGKEYGPSREGNMIIAQEVLDILSEFNVEGRNESSTHKRWFEVKRFNKTFSVESEDGYMLFGITLPRLFDKLHSLPESTIVGKYYHFGDGKWVTANIKRSDKIIEVLFLIDGHKIVHKYPIKLDDGLKIEYIELNDD